MSMLPHFELEISRSIELETKLKTLFLTESTQHVAGCYRYIKINAILILGCCQQILIKFGVVILDLQ